MTITTREEAPSLAKWTASLAEAAPPSSKKARRLRSQLARVPYTITLATILAIGTPLAAWRIADGRTPVYAARAEVLANETSDTPNGTQFAAAVATQRVVMRSRAVVEPVAAEHGLEPADLEEALTVEDLTGSTVLQVTVADEDPELALAVVESMVNTYLALAPVVDDDSARELLLSEVADLEAEQRDIEEELVSIEANNAQARAIGASPENPTRERRLTAQSAELERRIGNLRERLTVMAVEDLESQEPETSSLVSSPFVLRDPVSPNPVRAAALGALVGFSLAGALILVWVQSLPGRRNAATEDTDSDTETEADGNVGA